MTTTTHATWKVTPARRLLVAVGWVIAIASCAFGVVAVLSGATHLWGAVALLALVSLGLVAALPEPVPHDMLTGSSTKVDSRLG